MDLELSVSNVQAKARALEALAEQGYRAEPGPVRLAYPFAIRVVGVEENESQAVVGLVARVDPCVGRITVTAGR